MAVYQFFFRDPDGNVVNVVGAPAVLRDWTGADR
jgi:hypothetical protein